MKKYHIHVLLIVLGSVLYFFSHFQRTAIPAPIFDLLQSDFNVSATKITVLSAFFMYSYAIGTLLSGFLVDKFGGLKVLLYGSVIFCAGSLLFTNSNYFPLLYLARGLIGFGAASFYISLVSETKKCFPDRYFGIILSIILFVGYFGGIVANAPFTALTLKYGWHGSLNIFVYSTLFFVVSYIIVKSFFKTYHSSTKEKFSFDLYKEIFRNKNNYFLFTFYIICTALHYTIMTVIGIKFLTDYLSLSNQKAAVILSLFVIIAAVSGIILSSICKMTGNKRVLFLKLISYSSFINFSLISLCVMFNFKTIIIPASMLVLAFNASNTPITVPIAVNTNRHEVASTALSIMNSCAFITVGLFATLIGFLLDLFPSKVSLNGHTVYSNEAYFSIFLLFAILSIIEIFVTMKIKENV